ncbi:Arc family DNA-binding protein [Nitrosomonas sp.]|uniref:Arc family DNA-binding protein n=1 Tax=Nitrosomonas sp. TaxID=42353 RepID=UPI003435AB74|nr:hypothetical protein [Nitrosomonas sp.]
MKDHLKVQLRLPLDVHQWLVKFAAENDRSMNSQMITILKERMREQSANKDGPSTMPGS